MFKKKLGLFLAVMLTFTPLALADVTIGQPAPDFTLTDIYDNTHILSVYKGKYIVLEWLNHDCPFVKKHYNSGNMQALQKEVISEDNVWLSINSSAQGKEGYASNADLVRLTLEKGASPTAILIDSDGKVGRQYGAQTTPHMYIINPEGVLIYQGAIDDEPTADEKDVPTAKNYVREALAEAKEGKPVSNPTTKAYGCSVKY